MTAATLPCWPLELSAESVSAVLDGRKSETRRLAFSPGGKRHWMADRKAGDILYVREPVLWNPPVPYGAPQAAARYAAPHDLHLPKGPVWTDIDLSRRPEGWSPRGEATRARYMPGWAGRLCVRLTDDVRIEPLRGIDARDAEAEGIAAFSSIALNAGLSGSREYYAPYGAFLEREYVGLRRMANAPVAFRRGDAVRAYYALWDHLNASRGAAHHTNPPVCVIRFEPVLTPIEDLKREWGGHE